MFVCVFFVFFFQAEDGIRDLLVTGVQTCALPISGKGFILRWRGSHVVFPELRRDSRVTTGNSGCLLCWPRQVQSSIRVAKESWGLLSSDCRANRPHLGLCPEANVPLQGRQGSRDCIPDAPGETGIHLEWKQRTPLCSRIATGISWSSLGDRKSTRLNSSHQKNSYAVFCLKKKKKKRRSTTRWREHTSDDGQTREAIWR